MNPQNIITVGISQYIKNPNNNAANGSAPDSSIEEVPESIWFRLTVDNMYGIANENVECRIRNMTVKRGLIEMKFEISPKSVNGINAIEMNIIE